MSSEENLPSVQEAGPEPESEHILEETPANPQESADGMLLLEGIEPLTPPPVVQGEIIQGRVLNITDEDVVIDIGLKTEATVPRAEFLTSDGQLKVAAGEMVDVWVERFDELTGIAIVSHVKAAHRKIWESIERTFQDQTSLPGKVVERIKGGLIVDIGVRAFLPASHADARPHPSVDALLGQEITCKVIKLNRKRNNVVVSRKLALEEELNRLKAGLMERLVEGAEMVGKVKSLTDYGVFIDLGGMDGLLHITDLSWGRVGHPSEVVQVGQEITVKILKHDRERGRVSLGLKQLTPDPWQRVPETYQPGDKVQGRVVSLTDYGAFVEIEPGVEGLIHISEMSWSKRLRHPSKILKQGELVDVRILEVNPEKRRISLSLKATLPDPWSEVANRFEVGQVIQGRVRNLTEFGAFVEVEEGVDGLIHLSNLSWTKSAKHPSEVLKKGQKVEAVILALDPANRRLSLGLKQLSEDPWQVFLAHTRVGDTLRGKISRLASFGAFVELQEGVEGLCHVSEFDEAHSGSGSSPLEVGSEHEFRVLRLNATEKKVGLSMRGAVTAAPAAEPAKQKEPVRMSTMAEALSSAGITPFGVASSSQETES